MGGGESKHGQGSRGGSESDSIDQVLESLGTKQTKAKVVLAVDRANLNGTISHFKQSGSELHPLLIRFNTGSDEEYVTSENQSTSKGIIVENLAGPNREFYTLLLKELKKSKYDMFEGHGSVLLPVNNQKAIDSDMFKTFGKIVVSSLVSGGPGFPYFPSYIVHFLQGREYMHEVSSEFIINKYLLEFIENIEKAEDQDRLNEIIGNDTERFMDNCGWGNEMVKMENRRDFIQTLVQWDLFHKRRAAIEQIRKGLETLDFLEETKHLSDFEHLFLCRDKRTSTAEYIKERLVPEVEKLTPNDEKEETAKTFTLTCLEMLEEKESAYLFQFITGLDDVPTTDISFQVEFNRNNTKATLPEAITCSQCLILPLGNKTKLEFLTAFDKALRFGRVGFGGRKGSK